jgi:hypothetical protein
MKEGLLLMFTFCCFVCCSQDLIPIKILRLDSTTAIGKQDGEETSKEIGKEGARITSEDGRVELVFAEGSLSKKKKISIQPIINHATNGRGKAYRFQPSGLQFDKPVTIIFHFSDDEINGTLPELKGMVWQDSKGKWDLLPEVKLDTTAKTLTAQIQHFSSYASFDKLVLNPALGRVKVEKTQSLFIQFANYRPTAGGEDELPPLPQLLQIPVPQWEVNGISNGNSAVGRISFIDQSRQSVIYTAPASVPTDNPVAVTAQLKGLEFKFNKQVFKDPTLVSNLLIYDKAYRVQMNAWFDNGEDGPCTMRMEDGAGFTVVLEGTRTQIKEIANRNITLQLNPCYNCPMIWKNSPLKGPIHVVGTKRIDVTPASLPGNPFTRVRLLLHHIPSVPPIVGTSCPTGGGIPSVVMAVYLPPLIEFEANNEAEQVITLSELSNGSMQNSRRQGLKITIKRIDEE